MSARVAGLVASLFFVCLAACAADAQGVPAPAVFKNVLLRPVAEQPKSAGHDVWIRDGRIERIVPSSREPVAEGTIVIDGRDRYLLPGLAEMHVHLPPFGPGMATEDVLFLLLAHGVTTIRSTVGDPAHLVLREQVARRAVLGPRMFIAAPPLMANNTSDPQATAARIKGYAREGYDFLKLHPSLGPEAFANIVTAARSAGITVQGHVPETVGLGAAIDSRMRAIDHIDGFLQASASAGCERKGTTENFFGISYVPCVDRARLPEWVKRTKAAGIWIIPTLTHLQTWTNLPSWESLAARPAMRYLSPKSVAQWRDRHAMLVKDFNDVERGKAFMEIMLTALRELHAQGVPIALGSDTPQAFNIPGDSTLAELELMVDAGISTEEALRMATVNPATFFDAAEQFGSIRVGFEADLILLEKDPLSDVRAVRDIEGVMARGRWLSRETLDRGLDEIAARAARSH